MKNDINDQINLEILESNPEVLMFWRKVILKKVEFMNYGYWRGIFYMLPGIPLAGSGMLFYVKALPLTLSNILSVAISTLIVTFFASICVWALDRMTLRGLYFNDAVRNFFWRKFFISDAEIVLRYIKSFEK